LSATLSATISTNDAASHTSINNELQPANAKPDYAIKVLTECTFFIFSAKVNRKNILVNKLIGTGSIISRILRACGQ